MVGQPRAASPRQGCCFCAARDFIHSRTETGRRSFKTTPPSHAVCASQSAKWIFAFDQNRCNDSGWRQVGKVPPVAFLLVHAARCPGPRFPFDAPVPTSQVWEFHNGLRMPGVPAEMVTYPREHHGFRERAHQIDLLTRILAWYDEYLKS